MPFSPIVGAGVPGSDRLPDSMRRWRLHPIWYGGVEVAGSIYVPPHVSTEALRKALPPSFRFVGDAGVEDPFAGQPFEQGPFLKCFLHAEDLCQPSFTGEAILNYAALPAEMYGWQRQRIEYGFECACPETTIYLPPDFDDEPLERLLQPLLRH
jgi:hypothetical protein